MLKFVWRYFAFWYWADQYHSARGRIEEIDCDMENARRERRRCELRLMKAEAKCVEYDYRHSRSS